MGEGVYYLGRWEIYILKGGESCFIFFRIVGCCLKEGGICYMFFRKIGDGVSIRKMENGIFSKGIKSNH